MTILTNFKEYTPEDEASQNLQKDLNVLFIKSAEGADWYEAQKHFKDDLLKIVFDSKTGIILAASQDVSSLWPNGYSVADIDYDVNAKVESFEGKVFDVNTGKIRDRVYSKKEQTETVKRQIASLQKQAVAEMAPLQAAKELDIMTEEEALYYKNLQKYLVDLSRIVSQPGYPSEVEWPTMPKA